MFDWDSDYDSVIVGQPDVLASLLPAAAVAAPPASRLTRLRQRLGAPWRAPLRRLAGGSLMALAMVAGLAVFGSVQSGGAALGPSLQTLLALPLQMLGRDDSVMPEGLVAYDQTQYDNFRYGIAGFSDQDLLAYARATEAMVAGAGPLAAHARDALLLTYREMNHRGLTQIVSLARTAYPQM